MFQREGNIQYSGEAPEWVHGSYICRRGQELYERYYSHSSHRYWYQYEYRDEMGALFSTITTSLDDARAQCAAWKKTLPQYTHAVIPYEIYLADCMEYWRKGHADGEQPSEDYLQEIRRKYENRVKHSGKEFLTKKVSRSWREYYEYQWYAPDASVEFSCYCGSLQAGRGKRDQFLREIKRYDLLRGMK